MKIGDKVLVKDNPMDEEFNGMEGEIVAEDYKHFMDESFFNVYFGNQVFCWFNEKWLEIIND